MRSTIGGPDSLGGADADRVEPHHHQTTKRILFRRAPAPHVPPATIHNHNMKDQGVGPSPKMGVAVAIQEGAGAGGGSNSGGRVKSEPPVQFYSDGGVYKWTGYT